MEAAWMAAGWGWGVRSLPFTLTLHQTNSLSLHHTHHHSCTPLATSDLFSVEIILDLNQFFPTCLLSKCRGGVKKINEECGGQNNSLTQMVVRRVERRWMIENKTKILRGYNVTKRIKCVLCWRERLLWGDWIYTEQCLNLANNLSIFLIWQQL